MYLLVTRIPAIAAGLRGAEAAEPARNEREITQSTQFFEQCEERICIVEKRILYNASSLFVCLLRFAKEKMWQLPAVQIPEISNSIFQTTHKKKQPKNSKTHTQRKKKKFSNKPAAAAAPAAPAPSSKERLSPGPAKDDLETML